MGLPFGLGELDLKSFGTRLESADKTMAALDGSVKILDNDVKELTRELKTTVDQLRRFTNAIEDAIRELHKRS